MAVNPQDSLSECVVYAYLADILGDSLPIADATLYVKNTRSFTHGNVTVPAFTKKASFVVDGNSKTYASISVIETTTAGQKLKFSIVYNDGSGLKEIHYYPALVPNQAEAELNSISKPLDQDFG